MKKLILFSGVLIAVYFVFFHLPESAKRFSLDPFMLHEYWRFITYQFAHLSLGHLVENIVGLGVLSFIAIELNSNLNSFSSTYLASGLLSAIPLWLLFPFSILGASNAVLGGFGLVSMEARKVNINGALVIAGLTVLIFMKSFLTFAHQGINDMFIIYFGQALIHFSGLIFGVCLFYLIKHIAPIIGKKKRYVLRGGAAST